VGLRRKNTSVLCNGEDNVFGRKRVRKTKGFGKGRGRDTGGFYRKTTQCQALRNEKKGAGGVFCSLSLEKGGRKKTPFETQGKGKKSNGYKN